MEKMDAVVVDVRTDKQKPQMKAELKPQKMERRRRMTNGQLEAHVEKMDAAVMDVRTDKDQMKAELKPQKMLEREPEKAEIKSRPYIKVVLAGIFCLSLCANVGSLASSLASKETCVTGEGLLNEEQEVWG